MTPSCALEEAGLRLQHERFRQAGAGARLVDRSPRCLVVDLDQRVNVPLVDRLLAVERKCCPFFELRWEPDLRRLTVSASQVEHEPALDAIVFALGLERPVQRAASD